MNTLIPVKNQNVAARALGEYVVVIDLGEERMFHELNETAGYIWNLCDGTKNIEAITRMVEAEYEGEDVSEHVALCLTELEQLKLISFS